MPPFDANERTSTLLVVLVALRDHTLPALRAAAIVIDGDEATRKLPLHDCMAVWNNRVRKTNELILSKTFDVKGKKGKLFSISYFFLK
jgi:hypothetical protein